MYMYRHSYLPTLGVAHLPGAPDNWMRHTWSASSLPYISIPHRGALMTKPIKQPEMMPAHGRVMIQPP